MATVRPPVPPSRPANATAPRPLVSAVAPGNVVPAATAPVAAPVAAPVNSVAPVGAGESVAPVGAGESVAPVGAGESVAPVGAGESVAPVGAGESVAPTVPVAKKRGPKPGKTKKSDLTPYFGTYIYDEAGNALSDIVDGQSIPRRQKLETMPPLTGEGAFEPKKNAPLLKLNFKKLGDFFRHKSQLAELRVAELLAEAKNADEGKPTGTTGKLEKMQAQFSGVLAILQARLSPAEFHAMLVAQGLNPADFGLGADGNPVAAA